MNLSEGVVMGVPPEAARLEFVSFRDRPRSIRDAAYASLCAPTAARSRPASRETTDAPEAQRACVCCQTQASPATSSPFVEHFVSPYFSLHSHFAELARCYAPVEAVSINTLVSTNTPEVYESHKIRRLHKHTSSARVVAGSLGITVCAGTRD
jgi:hypothetical protein